MISFAFLLGYFIESIFGFACTIIAFAILGFVMDIKEIVFLGLFFATVASMCVIATDVRSLSKKAFVRMVSFSFPGALLGAYFLDILTSDILIKVFAIFLILFAVYSYFEFKINKVYSKILLLLSGVIHGIYGTGGPLAVSAMKDSFKNKSEMRVTFALFFISLNIVRGTQYYLQGTFDYSDIIPYWWMPVPIFLVIWLGHKVHVRISEKTLKKGIAVLLLISGVFFLLK